MTVGEQLLAAAEGALLGLGAFHLLAAATGERIGALTESGAGGGSELLTGAGLIAIGLASANTTRARDDD